MPLTPAAAQAAAQQIVSVLNVPPEVKAQALNNWSQIVNIIFASIQQNATVVPLGLIAPPGTAGGPVTGQGTVK